MLIEGQADFDAFGETKNLSFNIYKCRQFFKETTCNLSIHL